MGSFEETLNDPIILLHSVCLVFSVAISYFVCSFESNKLRHTCFILSVK